MGLIRKLFGQSAEPGPSPEWASFFKPGGYQAFEELVRQYLDSHGMSYELLPDEGIVQLTGQGKDSGQIGLGNLAQNCNQAPRRLWQKVVSSHFDLVLRTAQAAEATWDRLSEDFDEARPILKVRLYPSDVANQQHMVTRKPADDLIACLVYDLPESVASVHMDHAQKWGLSSDALFEIGIGNVRAEGLIEPRTFEVDGGSAVKAISGGSFFTASHALFLNEYLPPENDLGAIVCIPHRHTVMFHPIVDAQAVAAINAMIPASIAMFREGPGSISQSLYWHHDGQLQRQHTEMCDTSIEFEPTDEFIFQVLNKIRS